ncbi:MAG TPA: hypothetical protein EYQ64_04845 [Gemmatimonadetes bacterium]|nr:hypothetical protein [Gemmatimonadota bacterium]
MRALGRYALTGLLMIAAAIAALFPFLEDDGRMGVLIAAGIAFPVQVVAFGLLLRARGEPSRFFVWWGVGVLVRIGVVIIVGIVALRIESLAAEALLLSLAGFFFGLLLIEPVFLKAADKDAID